ncbi:hypothetical protein [Hymenobacter ruricola]|uniref:Uncharacterized protein n=1 Tax=Hymenobacter ruricola TaxID=2791023 RepID=A0ABS0I0B5_9BACT|nr:hypothetical protein [Hymenobacter ruricola]MBF9220342.1 hypothetical protein [Hymenobacter ruricola]
MRFFGAKDWIDKVPAWVWLVSIGLVTTAVVAVGVAVVAGGLYLADWLGWRM